MVLWSVRILAVFCFIEDYSIFLRTLYNFIPIKSSIPWCKGNCLILFLSSKNSEAYFLPLFSSVWYLWNLSKLSFYMKKIFFNQIVETIIFMLVNGLFQNNISLSWGTELLSTKQATSHGEDLFFHCYLFLWCFVLQWYVAASLCLYI